MLDMFLKLGKNNDNKPSSKTSSNAANQIELTARNYAPPPGNYAPPTGNYVPPPGKHVSSNENYVRHVLTVKIGP